MATERVAVRERRVAAPERRCDPIADQARADGGVPARHALRAGDDVGHVAELVAGEHLAQAAEGADHLVRHEQDVVAVADLADALEVPGRRREAATGVLHRLEEDRGDGVRPFELDRLLDLVGGPAAERLEVVTVLRRAVEVGVRHLERAGYERLEHLAGGRDAGDRQRAVGRAVVGDRAADHFGLHRLAGQLEVVLGHLPRGLDGLAAASGEEDLVQVAGRVRGEPVGELDRLRVGVGPQREEREILRLPVRGLGQLVPAVAGLHDEQPGQPVQVPLAVDVEDVGALAAHDRGHRRVGVGRQAREVHPEVLTCLGRQVGGVERSGGCCGHRAPQS